MIENIIFRHTYVRLSLKTAKAFEKIIRMGAMILAYLPISKRTPKYPVGHLQTQCFSEY